MIDFLAYDGNCSANVSKEARYSIKTENGNYVVGLVYSSKSGERWYPATDAHDELVDMVNQVKVAKKGLPGGAFYINEFNQVLVPTDTKKPYYLAGEYTESLEFEFEGQSLSGDAKDLNGNHLSPGDEWVGPHPGIPYRLAAGATDIYYIVKPRPNVKQKVMLSEYQDGSTLRKMCQMIAPYKGSRGGRFYINEFRQIFSPIEGGYIYIGKLEDLEDWFPKSLGRKDSEEY